MGISEPKGGRSKINLGKKGWRRTTVFLFESERMGKAVGSVMQARKPGIYNELPPDMKGAIWASDLGMVVRGYRNP